MNYSTIVIFCFLLKLALSDPTCFLTALMNCQSSPNITDHSMFCEMTVPRTECIEEAAVMCETGFEELAKQALKVEIELCTEGTLYNTAVKEDKNCGMQTLTDTRRCKESVKSSNINQNSNNYRENEACEHIGEDRSCMYQNFAKCSKDTESIFHVVYDSYVDLYTKVCEIIS